MSLTNEPFLYKDVRLLLNFTLNSLLNQAVCALRSLSIMGGIQNLIICVKMAWSEHLDRLRSEYSLITL